VLSNNFSKTAFVADMMREWTTLWSLKRLLVSTLVLSVSLIFPSVEAQFDWPEHSELSEGTWYRFSTARTGIYKLDAAFFEGLGLDVSQLNTNTMGVYGCGGDPLPLDNAAERPLDLMPIPVDFVGGADGNFSGSDHMLLYADGPESWTWSPGDNRWEHAVNPWSDSAFYFLRVDDPSPERITSLPVLADPPDTTSAASDFFIFHELEQHSLIRSGRQFYGEHLEFNPSVSVPFVVRDILPVEGWMQARVMGRSVGVSSPILVAVEDSAMVLQPNSVGTSSSSPYAQPKTGSLRWVPSGAETVTVSVELDAQVEGAEAWVDWLRLQGRRQATMGGLAQVVITDRDACAHGGWVEHVIEGASALHDVWDITDELAPVRVPFTLESGTARFKVDYGAPGASGGVSGEQPRTFLAFSDYNHYAATPIGPVLFTDVHGLPQVDLVMVSSPIFWEQTLELAEIHAAEGLSIAIVTPRQVYDAFSSGRPDPTAIRSLMKMLYDRAAVAGDPDLQPRYLQLVGDGTFENRNLDPDGPLLITYQSSNSWSPTSSYVSDDYFAFLADDAAATNTDQLEVGVGRFPCSTVEEAQIVLEKIKRYLDLDSTSTAGCSHDGSSTSSGPFGPWRNIVTFVSDDFDGSGNPSEPIHTLYSIGHAQDIEELHPDFDVKRIFMDAYTQISTPGGERYPEAEEAIRQRVQDGALIVNYIGHGGERGWAHERVLNNTTIREWTNRDRMPLFFTATCELARFDDPELETAGELMVLNPEGGAIAMMTTTRVVYSFSNEQLTTSFYDVVFDEPDGQPQRLGDIARRTKNHEASGNSSNKRNFTLLGDVALRLAIPQHTVYTSAINGIPTDAWADTLSALEQVHIEGYVAGPGGDLLEDFNGLVYPTVFDKPASITTQNNDGGSGPVNFEEWRNRIHAGAVPVVDGLFSFSFVVPRDIDYSHGTGRISYYAFAAADTTAPSGSQAAASRDAHGHSQELIVGGVDPTAILDDQGPQIQLFINDTTFLSGGTTSEDAIFLATIQDEQGINTVGTGIGHDLRATLDDDQSFVLNDYYTADLGTYTSGRLTYPLTALAPGTHHIDLRAWDVHNNSSTVGLDFVVVESLEVFLDEVLAYPNPSNGPTTFQFLHNQACVPLEITLRIYDNAGRLVWSDTQQRISEGNRMDHLNWNGTNRGGNPLTQGTYVYHLQVTTPEGRTADLTQRLVLLQ